MSFDVVGEAYDRFMGRYSRPLASSFADWLEVSPGQRALDVGCGPGALTAELVERIGAEGVAAVDPSEPFVGACRDAHPGADVRLGVAEALPHRDDTFDVAGACLVVHFMQDPVAGLTEMARVTRPGGWVGATVWDLAGGRAPMAPVWEAMNRVQPSHPGERHLPGGSRGDLERLLDLAGVRDIEAIEIPVTVRHADFEEWWTPYLRGVGPVGEAVAALDDELRGRLVNDLHRRLGDGPFDLTAVAFAARGRA